MAIFDVNLSCQFTGKLNEIKNESILLVQLSHLLYYLMKPNKKYQIKKRNNHSSSLMYDPTKILQDVKFRTYRSLESKKTDHIYKNKEGQEMRTNLRRQLDVIESANSRSWLLKPGQDLIHQKNTSDLMSLIKHQKSDPTCLTSTTFKNKLVKSYLIGLQNESNLNVLLPSILYGFPLDASITRQRSNSHDYSQQPVKVKLFKKMSAFNKRENFDQLSNQKYPITVRNNKLQQSALLKKRTKSSLVKKDSQTISLSRHSAQSNNQPEIYPSNRTHKLLKQESFQCKGEILAKDDEVTRRKRCIRQLSIIERQMEQGSKQPVFLFQL